MSDMCDGQRSISYVLRFPMPVAQSVQTQRRYTEAVDRLHVPQLIYLAFGINARRNMCEDSRDIHVLQ